MTADKRAASELPTTYSLSLLEVGDFLAKY